MNYFKNLERMREITNKERRAKLDSDQQESSVRTGIMNRRKAEGMFEELNQDTGSPFQQEMARFMMETQERRESSEPIKEELLSGPEDVEHVVNRIIHGESGGDPNAKNPMPGQTAGGLGGYIDSTWISMDKQNFPNRVKGKSDREIAAMKFDKQLARQMVRISVNGYKKEFERLGVPFNATNAHLAHLTGSPSMVAKWLSMDPSTPAKDIVPESWAKANPGMFDKTIGHTINIFKRKHS